MSNGGTQKIKTRRTQRLKKRLENRIAGKEDEDRWLTRDEVRNYIDEHVRRAVADGNPVTERDDGWDIVMAQGLRVPEDFRGMFYTRFGPAMILRRVEYYDRHERSRDSDNEEEEWRTVLKLDNHLTTIELMALSRETGW